MSVRLLLTDEAWAEIASVLTAIKSRAGSPPVLSDRMFIEAVLYLARTGTPWRDLPEAFGHWDAVYNRFRRWERRGSGANFGSVSRRTLLPRHATSFSMRRLSAPINTPQAR